MAERRKLCNFGVTDYEEFVEILKLKLADPRYQCQYDDDGNCYVVVCSDCVQTKECSWSLLFIMYTIGIHLTLKKKQKITVTIKNG